MIFYWTGIFFLSSTLMFLHPVYGVINSSVWIIFFTLGCLSIITGYYRTKISSCINTPLKIITIMVPSSFALFTLNFPYNLSFQIIIAGVIFLFFFSHKFIRPIWFGLILSGIILSFQNAWTVFYFKFAARFHEADFLNPFIYTIFKILNVPCSYSRDILFVKTPRSVIELAATWEKLGLYFFLCYLIGGTIIILLFSGNNIAGKIKKILVLSTVLIIYSLIRYTFLSFVFIDTEIIKVFWEPLIIAGSYLPLPLLVNVLIKFRYDTEPVHDLLYISKKTIYAGIASFILFFSLSCYFSFQDPGKIKKGRILIDEYYSNWEWTERELDTKWYGIQSVYNYYNFGKHIRHYYSANTLKGPLTRALLSDYDVFIIKTPTRSFSKNEISAIVSFVENGGGIFLIGDHTNVFGTTDNINPLAARFGITFNYDATYDLRTSDLHFHENKTLLKHPAVVNMPYFLFATSCSMDAPFLAEDIMTASNLKTMYLDYSRGGYFPDKTDELNYTFGLFLQSAGLKFGKGRVVAFTDSTCFSNFYMHIPGKPEYAIGTINWLNRSNLYDTPVKAVCIFVMLSSLAFLLFTITRLSDKDTKVLFKSTGMILCLGLLGFTLSVSSFDNLAKKTYVLPEPHTPFKKVGFENSFCDFKIPNKRLLHKPAIDFQTFYVWTQRLGYVPDLFSLENFSPEKFELVVIINPDKYIPDEKLDELENYINRGGRLLLIDKPVKNRSVSNEILKRFNLRIRFDDISKDVDIYSGITKAGTLKSFAAVEGGEPILLSNNKKVLVSVKKTGKGMIAVMACSPSFTNKEMGKTETIPDSYQQFLYRLEFWIMKGLMEKKFEPF